MHFHTRCGNAIYSILGPRYLKLLKRQWHKESISCKEEEPITLNHVTRVKKKRIKKVKEEGKKRYYLKLMIVKINLIVLAHAALLSTSTRKKMNQSLALFHLCAERSYCTMFHKHRRCLFILKITNFLHFVLRNCIYKVQINSCDADVRHCKVSVKLVSMVIIS